MRTNWTTIRRGDIMPQQAGIYVTMNQKGEIVMSRVTYKMLDSPKAVMLLFDVPNLRIGLKPTHLEMKNAYPVRVASTAGAKKVHAYRLMVEQRIKLPHTVRFFDAEIDEDGILTLDLRTAKPCPRAAAWNRRLETRR